MSDTTARDYHAGSASAASATRPMQWGGSCCRKRSFSAQRARGGGLVVDDVVRATCRQLRSSWRFCEGFVLDRAIPSVSTDSEILLRSRDSPSAFAGLFERHAAAVAAFIRRRVGVDAVEDVLSETFLVAFRRRASFDDSWESARPWLLGIASRVLKKYRADEARQWRAAAASAHRDDFSHAGGIDTAGQRIDAEAAVQGLMPRIAALSARDRETLLLYAWGNLTQEEVATALGIPVGTVGSRLNRIRRKLAPPGSQSAARLSWLGKEDADGRLGARA